MINEQKRKNPTRDDWETPYWLFQKLNGVFNFQFDAAASEANAKCAMFTTDFFNYNKELLNNYVKGWVWCNPPYSREAGGIEKWVSELRRKCNKSVILIPASVGSGYWHRAVWPHADAVCLLNGRIKFVGAPGSPMFDSALVIFGIINIKQYAVLRELGHLIERQETWCIHSDDCKFYNEVMG